MEPSSDANFQSLEGEEETCGRSIGLLDTSKQEEDGGDYCSNGKPERKRLLSFKCPSKWIEFQTAANRERINRLAEGKEVIFCLNDEILFLL